MIQVFVHTHNESLVSPKPRERLRQLVLCRTGRKLRDKDDPTTIAPVLPCAGAGSFGSRGCLMVIIAINGSKAGSGTLSEHDDLLSSHKEWLLRICVQGALYPLHIRKYDVCAGPVRTHDDALDLAKLLENGADVRLEGARREIGKCDGHGEVYLACILLCTGGVLRV